MKCTICGQPIPSGRFCSRMCEQAARTQVVHCEFCGWSNRADPTAPVFYCEGCRSQLWRGRHFDRPER
jgi:hypothetical protein